MPLVFRQTRIIPAPTQESTGVRRETLIVFRNPRVFSVVTVAYF